MDLWGISKASSEATHCRACANLSLSPIQTSVYHTLHDLIDKGEPKVILIDAPSGTGKTRILSTLAQNYRRGVQFAVLKRDQASQLTLISGVSVKTHCTYLMKNFGYCQQYQDFDQVRRMFTVKNLSNTDVLFKLITYAQEYRSQSTKVIIMDDCAIMNPLMLLLLYIVSLRYEITLIFSGNTMQLRSMNETQLHSGSSLESSFILYNRNNYDVLELFSNLTITELTENLRSDYQSFLKKVARFGNAIAEYRTKKPFHFNLRYLLYTLFRGKFNPMIPHSRDALFMAQFHAVITERLYRWLLELMTEGSNSYRVEYFNEQYTPYWGCNFTPGLILVKNFKYIYINQRGVNKVVVLDDMVFDPETGGLVALIVRFEDGSTKRIARCILNSYQLLHKHREWLMGTMRLPCDSEITNFPLKHYTTTYHATSGRTISGDVELSIDCTNTTSEFTDATAVYIGLCSLSSESNIRKFHAEQYMPSFVATDIMATEDKETYYYRCPATGNFPNLLVRTFWKNQNSDEYLKDFLKSVAWETVDDIDNFENDKFRYLKIKRSFYENDQIELDTIKDSRLMEITKFVKDKPHVVIDVIEKIQDFGLEEAREVLVDAYEKWE
ncbi:uncharacterized protein LOC143216816 [Lasioglossum baleicum]|uniref:uncharacterized protein LOC143216816 n=1 Tax=Lasioglossum baleicum TaxID=434251 RepID=UPI003FCC9C58